MIDLRTSLERMLDGFRPPDDAYERLVTRRARRRRGQRRGTAFVALAVAAAGIGVAARAFLGQSPRTGPSQQAAIQYPEGWTELATPPEVQSGAALVRTGSELLTWGGCDADVQNDCVPTDNGYSFDPATDRWSAIPAAPGFASAPHGVWTGREAIFIDEETLGGVAFDPPTRAWRTLPEAPVTAPQFGAVHVWTGSEVIVWGGGDLGEPTNVEGAAYNPSTDRWRRMAEAPVGLNLASAVWTGREVLVFGSLLDDKNWAATVTSGGAAYDPALDRWRELPPSELSPQATSAVWTGESLVAWDYDLRSQEYDPVTDRWSEPQRMPLDFSECYPDSVAVEGRVFAFFCGRVALYEPATSEWTEVTGGPLDEHVYAESYQRSIELWQSATLLSAHDAAFLMMEGITLSDRGEACYGCPGSPHSFWVYSPPTAGS